MNATTKKALEGSIKKWQKIVDRKGKDHGWTNCPLCRLCWSCEDCPAVDCSQTPFRKWEKHHDEVHPNSHLGKGWEIECKICERHAKAELEFLKSLLPK